MGIVTPHRHIGKDIFFFPQCCSFGKLAENYLTESFLPVNIILSKRFLKIHSRDFSEMFWDLFQYCQLSVYFLS